MQLVGVKWASEGVTVMSPQVFPDSQLRSAIASYKSQLPLSAPIRVLVFVHGYNVNYVDAAKSAARLAFGLRVNFLPIVVSWPSQGKTLYYAKDEDSVQTSVESLRPIFRHLLTHPDIDEVTIVCHSMGARLVTRVLSQLELQNVKLDKLWRIAYAAADLSESEFRSVWPRLASLTQRGWTFYTSANDFALWASRFIHQEPRIGDSKYRVFVVDKSDTIDSSAVSFPLHGYGHSYLFDSISLQSDLSRWMQGVSASTRGLGRNKRDGVEFWELSN